VTCGLEGTCVKRRAAAYKWMKMYGSIT
jgi:hypothetical protein